jgi:hypothetical protein
MGQGRSEVETGEAGREDEGMTEQKRKPLPLKPGVVIPTKEGPHFICPNQSCGFEG